MRTTILPSMLEILTRNYNYRNKAVRLYEIGKVYFARPDGMADEPKLLCLGGYGGGMDFFQLKGAVERILAGLRITDVTFEAEQRQPVLSPRPLREGLRRRQAAGRTRPDPPARRGELRRGRRSSTPRSSWLGELLAARGATPVYTPAAALPGRDARHRHRLRRRHPGRQALGVHPRRRRASTSRAASCSTCTPARRSRSATRALPSR